MEDLLNLESSDTSRSREVASKIQSRLKGTRDPSLLGDLVDFYFVSYSKRARKILTTLREAHSQDFFNKLNECIWDRKILPVFKLLAHALNSQQTSWMYRIIDHPLFSSILLQLEDSDDVVVLSMGVLVVAAILPLVPTYINNHLQRLFSIFCDLAIIRTTKRLGFTPQELVLHLDVSVYYLFLQLYALFPCNLFSFFKKYCGSCTRTEANAFQEFITPLFYQVQLHPGLVTDSCGYEQSKAKWGAMEPSDIATLSLQYCLDSVLSKAGDGDGSQLRCPIPPPAPTASPSSSLLSTTTTTTVPSSTSHTTSDYVSRVPDHHHHHSPLSSVFASPNLPTPSGPLNPGGLKTSEELGQFWSPSINLGHCPAPGHNQSEASNHSSRGNSISHLSLVPSLNYSTPNSDSAVSSALHTPGLPCSSNNTSVFKYKNYSPTASVGEESLFSRGMSQSAVFAPPPVKQEEFGNVSQVDPLSKSMRTESSFVASPGGAKGGVTRGGTLRNKLGLILGLFKKEEEEGEREGEGGVSEDYIELFVNDTNQRRRKRSMPMKFPSQGIPNKRDSVEVEEGEMREEVVRGDVEVGEEVEGVVSRSVELSNSNDTTTSAESPVDSHRQSGVEGLGQVAMEDSHRQQSGVEGLTMEDNHRQQPGVEGIDSLDISNLPLSNRVSRSDSESSQSYPHHLDLGCSRESPTTAGTGQFDSLLDASHSYRTVGLVHSSGRGHNMSSSFPRAAVSVVSREGGGGGVKRKHTSNSETEMSVHCLQEKLQKLVESKESSSPSQDVSTAGNDVIVNTSPLLEPSLGPESGERKETQPMMDSMQLRHQNAHLFHHPRVTMRRVSVCSRKGPGTHLTSESSGDSTTIAGENQGEEPFSLLLSGHPSPLVLLDQFVSCGEVLHRGGLDSVPLAEQEGVDWNHFGGCPHTEEFRIMQSQVVLLYSQLLFERHQCIQHAKRNRRLLSKARSAAHVTEELVSLRNQLHMQQALVSSLHQKLLKASEGQGSKSMPASAEESCLALENAALRDSNARLDVELSRMRERNEALEKQLKCSNKEIFSLKSERQFLEPRLLQADHLQSEVDTLTKEFHYLCELQQQQKGELTSLRSQSQEAWQWWNKCASLEREKERDSKELNSLRQALGACQARVRETEAESSEKEVELQAMHVRLEEERERAWNKIRALEGKYGSMKVIGQQLESHVMELKGRTAMHKKKANSSLKHRRNLSSSSCATFTSSLSNCPVVPSPVATVSNP